VTFIAQALPQAPPEHIAIWSWGGGAQHFLLQYRLDPQLASHPDAVQVAVPFGTEPQLLPQVKQCVGLVERL
jgi:hypothetical protein